MKQEEFMQKRRKDGEPTALELEVAKACADVVESSSSAETKAAMSHMRIIQAKEVEVETTGKKALVIFASYKSYKLYIQPYLQKCLTELEKKTKRHVVIVANRKILKPNQTVRGFRVRPFSRSLTHVHEQMLEDIVAPTEIVGKRLRIKTDGSQLHKVFLDPRDRSKENVEEKILTFAAVYATLTGKKAVFDFPEYTLRD